jgi:hypothetical protein
VRERDYAENPWRVARVKSRRHQPVVAKEKWRVYENFNLAACGCVVDHRRSTLAADKTFIDYFQPAPIVGALTTNTWGAAGFVLIWKMFGRESLHRARARQYSEVTIQRIPIHGIKISGRNWPTN